MCWTLNAAFRTDRKPTARRDALVAHFASMRDYYEIASDRIRVLANPLTKYMVAEGPDLVRAFFAHYGVGDDVFIFSDGGNSLKEGDVDVLLDLGFARHYTWPSASHMFLSPNDNDIHGVAKVPWRNNVEDFSDDVMATCCLLNYLDVALEDHSERCWKRNFLELTERA